MHSMVQVQRASMTHTPPQSEWQADMQSVHDSLAEPSSTLPEQLSDSNSHAALDEFSHNGQAGLDDLLDALDGGLEVWNFPIVCSSMIAWSSMKSRLPGHRHSSPLAHANRLQSEERRMCSSTACSG